MNRIRKPYIWEVPAMKSLWQIHFGGSPRQLRRIFSMVHDRNHALILKRPGDRRHAAQIFWQDCVLDGKPVAYIGGFAVQPPLQGQELGSELLEAAHEYLKRRGYAAAVLVPLDEDLVRFYHYFDYKPAGFHDVFFEKATSQAEMTALSAEEYHRLRRDFLPENGLELPLDYFRYRSDLNYYRGQDFICAIEREPCTGCEELLGDRSAAGGIAAALGLPHILVRTPGAETPDCMLLDFSGTMPETVYLGFASD